MSYSEPPPPPPPQYGAPVPPYGGGQPAKNSVMAIIGLVLGVVGLPLCTCGIFSIAAIVLGYLGKREIRESNGAKKGAGLAQAAFILGIVGVVLGAVIWVLTATGTIDLNYSGSIS